MGASGSHEPALPAALQISCGGRAGFSGVHWRWEGHVAHTTLVRRRDAKTTGITTDAEGVVTAVASGGLASADLVGSVVRNVDELTVFDVAAAEGCGGDGEALTLVTRRPATLHNGFPAWAKDDTHCLYATREGKWMLTDSGERGMTENKGTAMTSHHSSTTGPHEMEWMLYDRDRRRWVVSVDFALWELSPPRFTPGQLVEYKTCPAADTWCPGIVERAAATADISAETPHQYTVVSVEGKQRREVFACCVRGHAAYRDAAEL